MLVYIFIATMYKKFLNTINGSSLEGIIVTRTKTCLFEHQIPTFPIIITNIMTIKIKYHIFLYIINTNSFSIGQWVTKHRVASRNSNLLYIYLLSKNNLKWVNINMQYVLIEIILIHYLHWWKHIWNRQYEYHVVLRSFLTK